MFYSRIPAEALAAEDKSSTDQWLSGWRLGSILAASAAWIVFIINISFFAWMHSKSTTTNENGILFQGNCKTSNELDIFIHLAINILSTCLLGASNYCMQCLNAPTRDEVDKAHANKKWLDIGVLSLRNLRIKPRSSVIIWSLLGLTSIPLHLLYNSIIFTSSQANQYSVALVSQDFLTGAEWSFSCDSSNVQLPYVDGGLANCEKEPFIPHLLEKERANSSSLQRLSNSECIEAYATGFVSGRSDVVLVSTLHNPSNSLLWSEYPFPYLQYGAPDIDHSAWVCTDIPNSPLYSAPCTLQRAQQYSTNWTINKIPIEYCLSKVVENHCQLQYNVFILLIVAICNLVKASLMTWIALKYKTSGLMTLGDALSSFLRTPDQTTEGICLMSSKDIRRGGWEFAMPQYYRATRDRWWKAVSSTQWWISHFIFAGFFASVCFGFSIAAPAGFYPLGTANPTDTTNVILGNLSAEVIPTILVADLPQIGLSLSYLFFNHFYTSLSVAREWSQYGQEKKGLRVSQNPVGSQEKTRFLSLPGLHSACLMIMSALLHWLLSQSFFLVYINVLDADGMPDPSDSIVVIGYSAVGLLALMLVLLVINFTTFMLGVFKRFPEGMPLVGTCSAGISAGCHPLQEGDISGKSVSWGLVSSGEQLNGHCSFTCKGVEMPILGYLYGGYYCQEQIRCRASSSVQVA